MKVKSNPKCILDTNVIYPIEVRDLLFWLAFYELFEPKWSKNIFEEWKWLMLKKGIEEKEAMKRIQNANLAFPNALVKNYEFMIPKLILPDKNDIHVLAAAIHSKSNYIITNNVKDFPKHILLEYNIEILRTDDFIHCLFENQYHIAIKALNSLIENRKKNPITVNTYLEHLKKCDLKKTVKQIEENQHSTN